MVGIMKSIILLYRISYLSVQINLIYCLVILHRVGWLLVCAVGCHCFVLNTILKLISDKDYLYIGDDIIKYPVHNLA